MIKVELAEQIISRKYFFHRYCLKFARLTDDQLMEMAVSIKKTGQQSLVIYEAGKKKTIIDGRNRLIACEMAGVNPKFRLMKKTEDPLQIVFANNIHRRHSEKGMLAMLGADLMKEHREATDGRGPLPGKGDVREKAATVTGVSPRAVSTAAALQREHPQIADDVRSGKLTLNAADVKAKGDKKSVQMTFGDSFIRRRQTSLERIGDLIPGLKGPNWRTDPSLFRDDVDAFEKALKRLKAWHPNSARKKCTACRGKGQVLEDAANHKCRLCDNGYVGGAT